MKQYLTIFQFLIFPLSIVQFALTVNAQVALRPIAEHFTNTKCSICASRNPALYSNLAANPDVMYLSIHPSSPYSNCPLSQQNKVANDARTNFYGVYGSTPKLVINGILYQGNNFGSTTLFSAYQGLTTPFDLQLTQTKSGGDVQTRVVLKAVAPHSIAQALLFAGLAEDTVFVNGGNGEDTHPNVLRKALTDPSGLLVDLPAEPGDSVVLDFSSNSSTFWDFDRIFSIAILQDATTKELLQSGKTGTGSDGTVSTVDNKMDSEPFHIYPNPANEYLTVAPTTASKFSVEIITSNGKTVYRSVHDSLARIKLALFQNGVYSIKLIAGNKTTIKNLIIQK
ncbi:MAG: T9SS type A sorting domain-containing protein [Saprospiraceae bacterium]|nr:T9SS type A sorting domain-containing protein [Saprospiraceae bacterium]